MDKVLSSDLPPAYCTLSLSPEESAIAASAESGHDTEHLIRTSFDSKDNRVIFTQKVLAIFLLQKIGIGIILGFCLYFPVEVNSNFIWLVSMLLWWTSIFSMLSADYMKNRKIYNYAILVCYPIAVAFVILTLPVLVYRNPYEERYHLELLRAIFYGWMSYIAAGIAVLFYTIFSLDSKYEFKLRHQMITTSAVFILLYMCISIPFFVYGNFDTRVVLTVAIFLYLYHLYVLYDIDTMTGSNYRRALTPDDYVTGAVNLQIHFLFIVKGFVCETCCGSVSDGQ